MAKYSRLYVLNTMIETGLVPIFYNGDIEVATQIVQACADGGARTIEFTNRGDQAHIVFEELVRRFDDNDDVILGVGSVIDPGTTSLYLQLGANFIVSPILNPEMVRTCNRRKVACSPGCGTVSEISQAEEFAEFATTRRLTRQRHPTNPTVAEEIPRAQERKRGRNSRRRRRRRRGRRGWRRRGRRSA